MNTAIMTFLFCGMLGQSDAPTTLPPAAAVAPGVVAPSTAPAPYTTRYLDQAAAPAVATPSPAVPVCDAPAILCSPCCPCYCRELIWFNAEYLLWWTKSSPLPAALVTQGEVNGANPIPGALGQPGTRVLYGQSPVVFDPSSGYRVGAGFMLGRESPLFVEGSWLQLQTQTSNFSANSNANGYPLFAQPITSAVSGGQRSEAVSFPNPGGFAGGIQVENTTSLTSWDFNLGLDSGYNSSGRRFAFLTGVRSVDLEESLSVSTHFNEIPGGGNLYFLGTPSPAGSAFTTLDSFRTSNVFYGGQLGGKFTQEWGIFTLGLIGKVAMGNNHEVVSINGNSTLLAPGANPVSVPGGVLTLPSNIGSYSRNVFSVVPEGTLTLGVKLTERVQATVGYNILYMSNVVRPGSTIDTTVNRTNVPTDQLYTGTGTNSPARPAFPGFSGTDFWAQGLTLGLAFKY